MSNISAMVFAAGLGTRLYPLTADRPKALVEYQGRTLLDHVLTKIIDEGIQHIVVNIHHFPDMMVQYLKDHPYNADIEISDERDHLRDTGGGLKYAASHFQHSDHILLHNVDILSDLDLNLLIKQQLQNDSLATLAVRERSTSRYLLFDDKMSLCGWRNTKSGEETHSKESNSYRPFAFSGIHIVSHELINLIPSDEKKSITPIYLELAKNHLIKGFPHNEGSWRDMGKFEDFR